MKKVCEKCGTEIKRTHTTEDYLLFECQNTKSCYIALQNFSDNTDEDWEWVIEHYRKNRKEKQ